MRFRARLILLLLTVMVTISCLMVAGWLISNKLLQAVEASYQEGEQLTTVVNQAREAQVSFQRQVQEWKNILIRGHDPLNKAKHWAGFQERETQMNEGLMNVNKSLVAMGMIDVAQEAVDLLNAHAVLAIKYRDALAQHPNLSYEDQQAIDLLVKGIDRPTSSGVDKLVANIESEATSRFIEQAKRVKNDTHNRNTIIFVATLIMSALLMLLLLSMLRSLIRSLGPDPEDAVAATARIATGDLTERLNAKDPTSLMGALEMMQFRLRNINLAIHSIAQEIHEHIGSLPDSHERRQLNQDVENLHESINRIKIERDDEEGV